MLRLPPTMVVLGRSDLKDYERRRRRREAHAKARKLEQEEQGTHNKEGAVPSLRVTHDVSSSNAKLHSTVVAGGLPFHESHSTTQTEQAETREAHLLSMNGHSTVEHGQEEESSHIADGGESSPGTNSPGSQAPSSPSKDEFHYGGYVEGPSQDTPNLTQRSSPFAPDDVSTPQSLSLLEARGLRTRSPLPRSPLFISQNVSASPERRPTSGLTPRVASRVATHNTPGILFSSPARRPPRRSPRNFRHQTNSFSFDSSDRASAAYEQERISSASTNASTPRPSDDLSLHEELQGNVLPEYNTDSDTRSSESLLERASTLSLNDTQEFSLFRNDTMASPQLPPPPYTPHPQLPPPFSTSSRSSSRTELLPSVATSPMIGHPATSPNVSPSASPAIPAIPENLQNPPRSSPAEMGDERYNYIRSPARRSSPRSLFQRAVRVFSPTYHSVTPSSGQRSQDSSSSLSTSSTPRQSGARHGPRTTNVNTQTPSRTYSVYNDTLSPGTQPQTPDHLPESRHRSRFHPSYTAPDVRLPVRSGHYSTHQGSHAGPRRRDDMSRTPSRRGQGRTASPVGLAAGGYQGLYGGRENGDEEQNWAEGIRFDNAEVRLWGLRDARNDGRSMRETPEPDDWRTGLPGQRQN